MTWNAVVITSRRPHGSCRFDQLYRVRFIAVMASAFLACHAGVCYVGAAAVGVLEYRLRCESILVAVVAVVE